VGRLLAAALSRRLALSLCCLLAATLALAEDASALGVPAGLGRAGPAALSLRRLAGL
jgi:hypothetical protein